MIFPGKRPDQITEEDLNSLIENEVQERRDVEYKSKMYGTSDDDKREMLRDITAMANAEGGYILIGIQEEERIAKEIVGIENGDKEAKRIEDSCLSNIDPRIIGLAVHPVLLPSKGENKSVVAIYVPRSVNAPHMVTYKGLNQFWIRNGAGKSKMSTFEVKEAVSRGESVMEKVIDFLEKRKREILQEKGNLSVFSISATPLPLGQEAIRQLSSEAIDFLRERPKNSKVDYDYALIHYPPGPSLYGWTIPRIHLVPPDQDSEETIHIFRSGHIEYLFNLWKEEGLGNIFYPDAIVDKTVDFFSLVEQLWGYCEITGLFVARLGFYNAAGLGFRETRHHPNKVSRRWHREHMEIDPVTKDISLNKPESTAKYFCDRIWNAYGKDRCPFFDEEGNYTPRRR